MKKKYIVPPMQAVDGSGGPAREKRKMIKVRILVISDGNDYVAYGGGRNKKHDSIDSCHSELMCANRWEESVENDMVSIIEAEIPYEPNRLQSFKGIVSK